MNSGWRCSIRGGTALPLIEFPLKKKIRHVEIREIGPAAEKSDVEGWLSPSVTRWMSSTEQVGYLALFICRVAQSI